MFDKREWLYSFSDNSHHVSLGLLRVAAAGAALAATPICLKSFSTCFSSIYCIYFRIILARFKEPAGSPFSSASRKVFNKTVICYVSTFCWVLGVKRAEKWL